MIVRKKNQKCFNCSDRFFLGGGGWGGGVFVVWCGVLLWRMNVCCLYFRKLLFQFNHQTGNPLTVYFHEQDNIYQDHFSAGHLPCIMCKHTHIRRGIFLRKGWLFNANENNLCSRWEDRKDFSIVCRNSIFLPSCIVGAFFCTLCHDHFLNINGKAEE